MPVWLISVINDSQWSADFLSSVNCVITKWSAGKYRRIRYVCCRCQCYQHTKVAYLQVIMQCGGYMFIENCCVSYKMYMYLFCAFYFDSTVVPPGFSLNKSVTHPRQQCRLAQRWSSVGTPVPTLVQRSPDLHCCLGYYSGLFNRHWSRRIAHCQWYTWRAWVNHLYQSIRNKTMHELCPSFWYVLYMRICKLSIATEGNIFAWWIPNDVIKMI